ncbi:inosine-uridine nucleoside N-ribohydrolase [Actinoplanes ianthinogenes]|uniref:Inosine-uridine nucleoside N-ribohydrolase n=1 Tax=Actinoplanes ianthinogenes TaxID=122358 RepID=A0ABN6C3M0_9ACTN|nr:nucleoside hydrolase [Actinoplanes ianthinogenes]BCJ40049.1 inosine-uridine nucleoside N-ribohydrolase [Actinoplanes ianthinogenes]GGR09927.1 inosine-uridine nucleoside N-ribohydrolase [Actinoplanes ianthinogenes]
MLIYLDCDTGIDDALAIGYLLAHPDVTLAGIGTVNGNTTAPQAAANTLGLLALAGRDDIPVAVGSGEHPYAASVHGGNGIGEVQLPSGKDPDFRTAVELLVELARQHPGDLHVLATGPCGNLAAALRAEERLPEMLASVTVMGGAVRVPGNRTPHAEANIIHDPAAAAAVLAAPWPVTLVPLDVTMRHRWTVADGDALRAGGSPLQIALAEMLPTYFNGYVDRLGVREIPLHDPLAAAIMVGDVEPADAPMLSIRVEADGRTIEAGPGTVRTVLSLTAPAGPVLLNRILTA